VRRGVVRSAGLLHGGLMPQGHREHDVFYVVNLWLDAVWRWPTLDSCSDAARHVIR